MKVSGEGRKNQSRARSDFRVHSETEREKSCPTVKEHSPVEMLATTEEKGPFLPTKQCHHLQMPKFKDELEKILSFCCCCVCLICFLWNVYFVACWYSELVSVMSFHWPSSVMDGSQSS